MRVSLKTIDLCQTKYGKGKFLGFESIPESDLKNISENALQRDFETLTQNEMIQETNGEMHFTALAHHIFNMMLNPEQYMELEDSGNNIYLRIYIKNTYYLCVMEDRNTEAGDAPFMIELLPTLDLMVSAFVYTIHHDLGSVEEQKIRALGRSWIPGEEYPSEIKITGDCNGDEVEYESVESVNGVQNQKQKAACEISQFINILTLWIFNEISKIEEREVR